MNEAGTAVSSPMVGRTGEAFALRACVDRVLAGQGGIVSLVGEPGLGKSRLLAEVRRQLADRALLWREGRALSFDQTIRYWPFREIFRGDARIAPGDDEDTSRAKLEGRIATLFPGEVADILPYIATLLALPVREAWADRVRFLDGEAIRRQIFLTARRFVARLARERPLLLVFEDWQWADESSAALLEHLLPLIQEVPLLICAVSRPDPDTPATRLRQLAARSYTVRYTSLSLAPLAPSHSLYLLRRLLAAEKLKPEAEEVIVEKTAGNPFFIEEVARSLIETWASVSHAWTGGQAARELEQLQIPPTIQGVILARVDRLSERAGRRLAQAAVLGESFSYRVLHAVAGADPKLDKQLAELQRHELIREDSLSASQYRFKHALTQEAIYQSMPAERRRELHRQVGRSIEAVFADRLEEFCALLAYHYGQGEDWEKAQQYLFQAGDQAARVAADAEALTNYQKALAAYTQVFGARWDPVQRALLERKIGEALYRRGEHRRAREHLERALGYLGSPWPTSPRGVRLAIAQQLAQQAGHRLLHSVLTAPTTAADPIVEERARIYEVMGWIDFSANEQDFVLDVLLILNLSERTRFLPGIARGSTGAGLACDLAGVRWLAARYHYRAVALAERSQNPIVIGLAYIGMAAHEQYSLGRFASAGEYYRRAAAAFQGAGELRGWAWATVMMLTVLSMTDHFGHGLEVGLEVGKQLLAVGQDAADAQCRAFGLATLGWALWRDGAVDAGLAHIHQAMELFRAIPDYQSLAVTLASLGTFYLREGDLQQALAVLEESQQLIAHRGVRGFTIGIALSGLAEGYLLAAEETDATNRGDELRRARSICQALLQHGKCNRESWIRACRWQGTYEWLRGKPATAQQWWYRSVAVAEESGARYEVGLTSLEIGRHTGERSQLERAAAIFAEMRSSLDLARARDLLK